MSLSHRLTRRGTVVAAAVAAAAAAALGPAAPAHPAAAGSVTPQVAGATFLQSADAGAPAPGYTTSGSRRFTPQPMQQSYNLPALYSDGFTGEGQTIAIVDSFGYEQAGADLNAFSAAYGLPTMCGETGVACTSGMPKFSTLQIGNRQVKADANGGQSGDQRNPYAPGSQDSNAWSVEVALDIEWAHTVAPKANILLVETPVAETLGVQGMQQMMNAEQYVVDHHLADVISQSFGAAEGSFGSTASLENLRGAFKAAKAQRITVFASSGDYGSTGSSKQPVGKGGTTIDHPEVGWPASDPLVTAVGGTNLCTSPLDGTVVDNTNPPAACQTATPQRETAWNGSGGGYSHVFAKPDWQTGVDSSMRGVPDISWDSSCRTYVVVLDTAPGYGGWYGVCGTSAASPMVAGLTAIADQYAKAHGGKDVGFINDDMYALASDGQLAGLYDVVSGDNVQAGSGIEGYDAGPGWDAVTGLGTPADGAAFVKALATHAQTTS